MRPWTSPLGVTFTAALLALGARAEPAQGLRIAERSCGGVDLVVTSADRFDPMVQQLLVKQQLSGHPVIEQPRFLVIPYRDDGYLTEAQIRYLEQLLSRASRRE
ncbi:hypothetical protein [Motiliproteus sediminis]|uniref:hypothetical protein n=1 Tax=Motiliproteus sediminis TaxID=1468178 RepID=UPI001AEFED43|nr:hypothetical protein [Motiliproteus sediminis]